jgi:flagellar biosynthesis protein
MMYRHFNHPSANKQGSEKKVAVIRYDSDNNSPTVVAQGRGEVAEKILAEAKKHDIPLQEDALLLENLLQLDLGNHVPPQLYQVVAEVLLLVRRANTDETEIQLPGIRSLANRAYGDYEEDNEEDDDITIDDLMGRINQIE